MSEPAATTRDKLLDAAARLFAERGVFNVSLAEIVRAAGQRNSSAILYHFGSRDQVLVAFLAPHVAAIRARRLELLERARAAPAEDIRIVAEALVRPVTELAQRGWRERAYLQIGSELSSYLDRLSEEVGALLRETAGDEVMALLAERCPQMPREIWDERSAIAYPFIGRAAADRARMLDRSAPAERPLLPDDRFVANLVDMLVGAMLAGVEGCGGRASCPSVAGHR